MMKGKLTIKIDENITEKSLVESCLNMVASGYLTDNPSMLICFYALSKRWHKGKMIYYLNLIEKEVADKTERKGQ